MSKLHLLLLASALSVAAAGPARAVGDPNDPLWPCVQRKVVDLALASTWTGPLFEPGTIRWQDDQEVADLVSSLAQRRVALPDAEAEIRAFAASAGAEKEKRLVALFAGLFERLNQERRDVINGIDRFARKQLAFAETVKERTAEVDRLREDPNVEYATLQQKVDEVTWETRVFEERQKSLTFVCEVPVIIEQRAYALGKAITSELK